MEITLLGGMEMKQAVLFSFPRSRLEQDLEVSPSHAPAWEGLSFANKLNISLSFPRSHVGKDPEVSPSHAPAWDGL